MVATNAKPTTCHSLSPHKFLSVTGNGVDAVGMGSSVFTFGDGMNTSLFCAEHDGSWHNNKRK